MNYKIKSLLYLLCFIATAMVYNNLSEEKDLEKEAITVENKDARTEILADAEYLN
jgi:hypothetical protein